jgi:glycerol-3-phosphate acyltransferase PlsY
MIVSILLFFAAFLIGGFPTGYIAVRVIRKKDIREYGSGNIGFTNVFRTEGWQLGVLVLAIDVLKGFLTTFFLSSFFVNHELFRVLIGISVIAGNIFTPFLKFRGGKGVATSLGVTLAINPYASLGALCSFLITVKLSRYVSLGSMVAATVYAGASALFYILSGYDLYALIFAALLFIVIIIRHISNIKRLINGRENRIEFRKSG